jgi:TRAP-type C4-dicarboxylate transport system permease small subunit
VQHFLEKIFQYAALGAVVFMMFLVTADAAGRYLLNYCIFGAYEVTEQYLMVIAIFLGATTVYRGDAFISVSFLVDRLPSSWRLSIAYFNRIFSVLLVLFFIAASVKKAHRMYVSGATMDFDAIPLWPAYTIVSLGLILLASAMVLDIPNVRKGKADFLTERDEKGSEERSFLV